MLGITNRYLVKGGCRNALRDRMRAAVGRHLTAAAPTPWRPARPWRQAQAAQVVGSAAAGGASNEPDAPSSSAASSTPANNGEGTAAAPGGGSMDQLPRAVSLPMGLPTAGAVFVMAGFLKILIMCFPFSEMAITMYLRGRAELGLMAAVKAIPLALGLAAAAKAIVDRQLHKRRWAAPLVAIAGVLLLLLSRLIFARPKSSPLDPVLRQMAQERAAAAAEAQRSQVALQQRQHLLRQPDAAVGRRLEEQAAAQQPRLK